MAQKSTKKPANKPTQVTPETKERGDAAGRSTAFIRKNLKFIGTGAIVLLFAVLLWQYNNARSELKKHKNPDVAIQEEGKSTQEEVSKVMVLPKSETPTVANISDISKLKDRPFFANAENGDKVLIYKEAKKAIIYRPSTKQIVEVATYNAGDDLTDQSTQ